ncbi:DUF2203 domain-containing protein [Thalassorhabdus alkalitolerans]|uniref:DUF2203 domain-containing protein n=1 Tax=Thalassorhabdus alkalitolerans TaxID=2282697 RepID=A0ABW0YP93_9BACI
MFKKYFTIEEANCHIPFVKEEMSELQNLQESFTESVKHYELVKHSPIPDTGEKLFYLECMVDFVEIQANLHIERLERNGILVKSIDHGLVDFPAKVEGEPVLLCWRQGESQVKYYHGLFEGFTGRKKISRTDDEI